MQDRTALVVASAHGRRKVVQWLPGMRFEIIWNDVNCILFEKYGFFRIKSPIHVYQYEMPVPRGIYESVPDTPADSAAQYLHRIRSSSLSSSVVSSSSNCLTRSSFATSRAPRLCLGIRNNTIIRSGMKSNYFKFPS